MGELSRADVVVDGILSRHQVVHDLRRGRDSGDPDVEVDCPGISAIKLLLL